MKYKGLTLDRFQSEAIEKIHNHESVIISAPTGAGKTIIAEYAIERSIEEGKTVIYTAPIKALSNQKFRDFKQTYGNQVGIMTGDLTLNPDAAIVIMTTEIFRNALLEEPERFDSVNYLIFDEVHYLDDVDRGTVWEESIIFAPLHIKVVCLSATIPNVQELADWISYVRKDKVHVICETKRPVPLTEFCYLERHGIKPLKEALRLVPKKRKRDGSRRGFVNQDNLSIEFILDYIVRNKQLPVLYFVFSRKECSYCANRCTEFALLTDTEKKQVKVRLKQLSKLYNIEFSYLKQNFGSLLIRGIAYHHAGMLPAMKEVVELLFTEGLIKLLFATETFALGVNMPASSVVFHSIKKYDGKSVRILKTLEYQQMSGRAGRRGMDSEGYVYANLLGESATSQDLKKIFDSPLEPVKSQFNLSYSTLLNLYERLQEDILTASDRSFGSFQKIRQMSHQGKRKRNEINREQRQIVKKKLSFLKTLGYLQENSLTSKGRFASRINGYEIQLTELFFDGVLEQADERLLFILLVATVFEGKKGRPYPRVPQHLKVFASETEKKVDSLRKLEYMMGMREEVKPLDFRLSSIAYAWASGDRFDKLSKQGHTDPGDLIRNFRLAIQLLRQLRKICIEYESFVNLIDRCSITVNRDEVDALKQLEIFSDFKG